MPLDGPVVVRTPEGEEELGPLEVVAFPPGAAGAHKVTNRGYETVRVLMLSTKPEVSVCVYPDSDKVLATSPEDRHMSRAVDRGRLLRRGGVSVAEPLVFDTAVDLATETSHADVRRARARRRAPRSCSSTWSRGGGRRCTGTPTRRCSSSPRRGDVHGRRRRARGAGRADGRRAGGRRAPVREHRLGDARADEHPARGRDEDGVALDRRAADRGARVRRGGGRASRGTFHGSSVGGCVTSSPAASARSCTASTSSTQIAIHTPLVGLLARRRCRSDGRFSPRPRPPCPSRHRKISRSPRDDGAEVDRARGACPRHSKPGSQPSFAEPGDAGRRRPRR